MKKTFLLLALTTILVYSCKDDEGTTPDPQDNQTTDVCDTMNVVYTGDIETTITTRCGNGYCHGGATQPRLTQYDSVKNAVNNHGLITAISHEAGRSPMPKNQPKLDDNIIQRIKCWVEKGMPEN